MVHFWFGTCMAGVFGLIIGSFLNVVIYRYPKMMERQTNRDIAEYLGNPDPHPDKYDLATPRSTCGSCRQVLKWTQNIPIVGWLRTMGKCAHCGAGFSARYPLVELATGLAFGWLFVQHGISLVFVFWATLFSLALCLTMIDVDQKLLPDDMTLLVMWMGLLWSVLPGQPGGPSPEHALMGAAAGYISLWSVYWVFKLLTGKEGMGYGDFKWFAALGAVFGVSALLPILLLSSIGGVLFGVFSMVRKQNGAFPFGPFLSFGGFMYFLYPEWFADLDVVRVLSSV